MVEGRGHQARDDQLPDAQAGEGRALRRAHLRSHQGLGVLLRQVQADPLQGHHLRQVRRRGHALQGPPRADGPHPAGQPGQPHLVLQGHAEPPGHPARHQPAQPRAHPLLRAVHRHPRRRGRAQARARGDRGRGRGPWRRGRPAPDRARGPAPHRREPPARRARRGARRHQGRARGAARLADRGDRRGRPGSWRPGSPSSRPASPRRPSPSPRPARSSSPRATRAARTRRRGCARSSAPTPSR